MVEEELIHELLPFPVDLALGIEGLKVLLHNLVDLDKYFLYCSGPSLGELDSNKFSSHFEEVMQHERHLEDQLHSVKGFLISWREDFLREEQVLIVELELDDVLHHCFVLSEIFMGKFLVILSFFIEVQLE